jgi:2,4-dienoyl-CoA reductase-like NADH-dependent reductase (Old Yellow Enzyme family)
MCMYSADAAGEFMGAPTPWHQTHLASRAAGGAGLILTEATAVSPVGRITPWDLGLWNDRQETRFEPIARAISNAGAVPAIQLAHAGRKASFDRPWQTGGPLSRSDGGWPTVGPSPIAFGAAEEPHELAPPEIADVVAAFAAAAERALRAGFKAIEIHGAHGYLIHSFLSPYSNRRQDEYGGSFENRIRLALEVTEAVRSACPEDVPLLFRLSATDWLSENPEDTRMGWTLADSVRLAMRLKTQGVDFVDTSSGGLVPDAMIPAKPGFQAPFAAVIRREAAMPTGAVGLIVDSRQASEILTRGEADAVLVGRQLLRDPYWVLRSAAELQKSAAWPVQYGYAVHRKPAIMSATATVSPTS